MTTSSFNEDDDGSISLDLRQRLVDDYDTGAGTQTQLAEHYQVSLDFVEKRLR